MLIAGLQHSNIMFIQLFIVVNTHVSFNRCLQPLSTWAHVGNAARTRENTQQQLFPWITLTQLNPQRVSFIFINNCHHFLATHWSNVFLLLPQFHQHALTEANCYVSLRKSTFDFLWDFKLKAPKRKLQSLLYFHVK